MTLVVTLPLASRQTLAVALSNANPRRPNTPARAHDARWVAKLVNLTATGKCATEKGMGTGDVATTQRGTNVEECE